MKRWLLWVMLVGTIGGATGCVFVDDDDDDRDDRRRRRVVRVDDRHHHHHRHCGCR